MPKRYHHPRKRTKNTILGAPRRCRRTQCTKIGEKPYILSAHDKNGSLLNSFFYAFPATDTTFPDFIEPVFQSLRIGQKTLGPSGPWSKTVEQPITNMYIHYKNHIIIEYFSIFSPTVVVLVLLSPLFSKQLCLTPNAVEVGSFQGN